LRLRRSTVRLPLVVDAARLAAEVDTIAESSWRDHPEGAPGNTALALIAAGGNPDDDAAKGPMAPTPHLAALPYTRQILSALGATIGRSRLMRIATETELEAHVDTNYYWWHHLRIHVPVRTTPDVAFQVGPDIVHMAAGEVWAFDTWRRHRVDNPASSPRIHLVIDTVGSSTLWDLIENDDQPARTIEFDPSSGPSIPVESSNWPVVMSSAEVQVTLQALLDQARTIDPTGAERAAAVLVPFQQDWRDLEARFGERPEGWPTRKALLQRTADELHAAIGDTALPNGIRLVRAVVQLVLDAALNPDLARTVDAWRTADTATAPLSAPTPSPATAVAATQVPARPRPVPAQALLAGPPRIVDPIFVVCPPRSGSSLLFETLARAPGLYTVGGESHRVIEDIAALAPAAHAWDSNRLGVDDATDGTVAFLKDQFMVRLRDRDGHRPPGGDVRMLEKTPKNALRVPFLAEAFPDATFVYLYRDPRETVSSMLDAWRSGRFVTYPDLPGWNGQPWSLLLTPGWRDLDGRPLAEVVARQWATTVEVLLDDLEALDPDRWCLASYDRLVAQPFDEITRLCDFLDLDWDDELSEPLPDSRHTLDSPHPEKWRRNADELEPMIDIIAPVADRARQAFATPPRTDPVAGGPSVDGPGRRRRVALTGEGAERSADRPPAEGTPALAPSAQELFGSQHTASFRVLLDTLGASLLISTYQAGRLIMVRPTADGLNSHFRSMATPMGIAYDGRRLAIGTRAEVVTFQNQPALAARLDPPDLHDGCFVARHRHATGDIRVHDLAWADDGLWLVNTRFSCLATLDEEHSFVPRWQPPFITALTADDRCHLNGLAVVDGKPAYVTVLGITDEPNGWREHKAEGGAVLDVESGAVVAPGLSMPHSPRWHDGRLWVLQSGLGTLGTVDLATGTVETVARVPGFARGLTFAGQYAIIGLSKVREHVFDGLPLTRERGNELKCGVWVVDTETGTTVAHLAFEGMVQEIFEIALLRGLRYPELVEPGAPLADTAFVVP
jgi:uncharacterized protein (TIGR03032 family)